MVAMFETGKIIDNFVQTDSTVLYWIFAGTVGLILLVVVAHLLRNVFAVRIRQVQEFGMDFDAVAGMLEKGLLTAEEAKRVKSVLTRHFTRLYEQRLGGQPAGGLAGLVELERAAAGGESKPSPCPKEQSFAQPESAKEAALVQRGASTGSKVPPEVPPAEAGMGNLPLDVLDMYRAGMISDEEMAALRRFYGARARETK